MNQAQLKPVRRRVKYLLRDLFSVPRAAGAVNGTAAEPGSGTRVVTDTANKVTISNGTLNFAHVLADPVWGDPQILWDAFARGAGRALLLKINYPQGDNADGSYIAWEGGGGWGGLRHSCHITNSRFEYYEFDYGGAAVQLDAAALATDYQIAMVLRSTGVFFLVKNGAYSQWSLIWVSNTGNETPLKPKVFGFNAEIVLDDLRVIDLPAPWNEDYGLATQRLAGARADGDAFTHTADCLIEFTVTTMPFGIAKHRVNFRKQAPANYWQVMVYADGAVELAETVPGTTTTRGYAASAIANGQRVVVLADGSTIKVYANNVLKITYTGAVNFATSTQGELLEKGDGGAVSDIVAWPRVLSGAALSALNRV